MSDEAVIVLQDRVRAENLVHLGVAYQWRLLSDVPRAHLVLASRKWETLDGTELTYLEDHTGDVRFVRLRGENVVGTETLVRDAVLCFTEQELLRGAQAPENDVAAIRAYSRLSVCRPPEPDPQYVDLWRRGLGHQRRVIRRAAIRTAYGCGWSELIPTLEARLLIDDRLRPSLEHLLAHLVEDAQSAEALRRAQG